MNDYYISLPKEMNIPQGWERTPPPEDRVNQVAKSHLALWSEEQLKSRKKLLNICAIASIIGLGVSYILDSIPSAIFCGAGLIICLIGRAAIQKEERLRETSACQQTCLEIEDWLLQFIKSSEEINALMPQGILNLDNVPRLKQIYNELPENKVEELFKRMIQHHIKLFGKMREIEGKQISEDWMFIPFQTPFGKLHVKQFYVSLKHISEPMDNNEQLLFFAKHQIYNDFFNNNRVGREGEFNKLTGYRQFASIIDEAEYIRKNIAVFRASLEAFPPKLRVARSTLITFARLLIERGRI